MAADRQEPARPNVMSLNNCTTQGPLSLTKQQRSLSTHPTGVSLGCWLRPRKRPKTASEAQMSSSPTPCNKAPFFLLRPLARVGGEAG